jgi:pimeloyl-ACP methyl ester carboxylesterase
LFRALEVAMNRSRTDTLGVPGATLHYEVCGTAPLLLLIAGGPADAGGFAPIRNVLCDRYTVLTYDPRGLSRSPFDGEAQDNSWGRNLPYSLVAIPGTLPTPRPTPVVCTRCSVPTERRRASRRARVRAPCNPLLQRVL